jgi:hypothetical protein
MEAPTDEVGSTAVAIMTPTMESALQWLALHMPPEEKPVDNLTGVFLGVRHHSSSYLESNPIPVKKKKKKNAKRKNINHSRYSKITISNGNIIASTSTDVLTRFTVYGSLVERPSLQRVLSWKPLK